MPLIEALRFFHTKAYYLYEQSRLGITVVIQVRLTWTKCPVSPKVQPNTNLSVLTALPWHVSVVPCEGFIAAGACYCPPNTTLALCAKEQGEGVLFGLFLSLWIHCALCVCF